MHKEKAYYLLSSLLAKRNQILGNLSLPTYEIPWLRVPATSAWNDAGTKQKSNEARGLN